MICCFLCFAGCCFFNECFLFLLILCLVCFGFCLFLSCVWGVFFFKKK